MNRNSQLRNLIKTKRATIKDLITIEQKNISLNGYTQNKNILFDKEKNQVKCLYLIQTSRHMPELLSCLKKKDHILLSFKEDTPDTTIFFPNSTWTTGRNKIREHVLKLEKKYDYYIFLDEDVKFTDFIQEDDFKDIKSIYFPQKDESNNSKSTYLTQEDGFNNFEKLLGQYQPYIANPNYKGYYPKVENSRVRTTIEFDGIYNAFSKEAFFSNEIFPYMDVFDSKSWWMSQYIIFMQCSLLNKQVIVFEDVIISNESHSDYPRGYWEYLVETEKYVLNEIPHIKNKINDLNLDWHHLNFKKLVPVNNKCIVITTVNAPTKQVLHYEKLVDWDLIIVGDSKTDNSLYKNLNCTYLGLYEQKRLFPTLYDKIPLKSYTRKMFGYLYAIQNNYTVIYDTDDDNQYTENLNEFLHNTKSGSPRLLKSCSTEGFVNLYKNYTDQNIWPRGIPPTHKSIDVVPELKDKLPELKCAIIQGLVNNDPDVDAHYRINISDKPFTFEKDTDYDILLNKNCVCPFNTQNTFWTDPSIFFAMYLPVTVTFRYTDILHGFVALYQLWKNNKTIKFTYPTAIQERNPHDLQKDYESEVPMYETAEKVIDLLNKNKEASIQDVYSVLLSNNIVKKEEIDVLNEWMKLISNS
jgi:hypothetical protein